MSDDKKDDAPKKKKGKGKLMIIVGAAVVLLGGGVGGGLYAAGIIGGHAAAGEHGEASGYKMVPKSEQKRVSAAAGGEGEGHGGGGGGGEAPPPGVGGDKYASNYYTMDKEFTSNLKESVHFVQVGLAVSTPYDDTVIDNLKTNEIAVRSAILMTLSDTDEDSVFTNEGKTQLQKHLTDAINGVLKQKEGFGGISNVYFTSFVVQ